jgi:hypothetical protein
MSLPGKAQKIDSIVVLARKLALYQQQTLTEQLFLHLDRPSYVAGETMWFKAYAVDGMHHRPLAMSKVAYVEVLDAAQHPVLQAKIALVKAMGQGTFELPAELATGHYVVRAYTNWMKNAGPAFYFQCPVTIINTLQANQAASGPANELEYDLQFFPEGGQLVSGLPGRVAFKITDQMGRSVAATGTVADARGATLATFATLKFGLGSFLLTPTSAGTTYTASVQLPGGRVLTRKLPDVARQGYALVATDTAPNQLVLKVQASPDQVSGEPLRLLGHTGGRLTIATEAVLRNGQATFELAKNQLAPGITHLTVFSGRRPVAERLYFRRPTSRLAIQGAATAAAYGPRSLAGLRLQTTQPASLSLAVYRLDSLSAVAPTDITQYLLLAADLKGFIEDAGYYFRDSSATAQQAATNLMLTQGWRRFKWEEVLAEKTPPVTYPAELNGYLLRGRVSQPNGLAAPDIASYLSLPGRYFRFGSAVSHADGSVLFELPNFYGTQKLVFQTNPIRDSIYHLELLSPFTAGGGAVALGLFPFSTQLASSLNERHLQVQVQRTFATRPPRYSAVPGDTVAFYGKADEHYLLDDYTRFPTVEDVMREYVPGVLVRKRKDGFHFMVIDRVRHFVLKEDPLTLLDGLPIFKLNQLMTFDPLKIKQLDVISKRYFLGQQVYNGLVSYTTYKGDLGGFPLNPHALIEEYEGMQVPREFYAPRYDTPAQQRSRLPDLRNLLYWNPNVNLQANKQQTLEFSTSDQAGRYLVVTQGMTPDGQLGSTSFSFEVKPAL